MKWSTWWNQSIGFKDLRVETTLSRKLISTVGPFVHVSVRTHLWFLAAGSMAGVEITVLFAWATAVICFSELLKIFSSQGKMTKINEKVKNDSERDDEEKTLNNFKKSTNKNIWFIVVDQYICLS